jgi:hypothetical protein
MRISYCNDIGVIPHPYPDNQCKNINPVTDIYTISLDCSIHDIVYYNDFDSFYEGLFYVLVILSIFLVSILISKRRRDNIDFQRLMLENNNLPLNPLVIVQPPKLFKIIIEIDKKVNSVHLQVT